MISMHGKPTGSHPPLFCSRRSCRNFHRPCFGRMITQVCWECLSSISMGNSVSIPLLAPPNICNLCCTGEAEQEVGAKSYICKGNVQCFWHSDAEETTQGCLMCLAMVPMYYISLPAEISLSLCFMNIICLFKL